MVCHPISRPKNRADMVAPPAKGVMFHLSQEMKSNEDILKHIESFVMNPTKEKAICRSVKRFGLMPSQKENITSQELHTVAQWMIDNLKISQKEYKNRNN